MIIGLPLQPAIGGHPHGIHQKCRKDAKCYLHTKRNANCQLGQLGEHEKCVVFTDKNHLIALKFITQYHGIMQIANYR